MSNSKHLFLKLFSFSLIIIITAFFMYGCYKADEDETPMVKKVEKTGEKQVKAKITLVVGKAEITQEGNVKPAKIGMILGEDDSITTYKGSVDMRIMRLGVFKIKPGSKLKISSLSKLASFNLNKGKVLLALRKLGKGSAFSSFSVATPTAVVGVRGTSFLVSADTKSTRVGVLTGKVNVASGKKIIAVDELKQVAVTKNEIKKVSKMDVNTIVDVREILKIKEIDTMPDYKKIKINIKKLEIIESKQGKSKVDLKGVTGSIKAKDAEDKAGTTAESLKEKSGEIDADKTLESKDKKFVDDGDF